MIRGVSRASYLVYSRSYYMSAAVKDPVKAAIDDTFATFAKTGEFSLL
jgi:hypothetical protein